MNYRTFSAPDNVANWWLNFTRRSETVVCNYWLFEGDQISPHSNTLFRASQVVKKGSAYFLRFLVYTNSSQTIVLPVLSLH